MIALPTFGALLTPAPSSFLPSDLSGLGLWLKADAITGLSDGNPVSTWADSSGNGRDATGSGSARPTYETNELNGKPIVRFDGVDDTMSLAALTLTKNIDGCTVFVVRKWRSSPTTQKNIVNFYTPSTPVRIGLYGGISSGKSTLGGRRLDADSFQSVTSSASVSTTNFEIQVAVFDYANSDLYQYINGTLDGASTSFQTNGNTSNTDSFAAPLGSAVSASNCADIDIAEIIVYNRALNSTERGQVTAYLGAKYAISVT